MAVLGGRLGTHGGRSLGRAVALGVSEPDGDDVGVGVAAGVGSGGGGGGGGGGVGAGAGRGVGTGVGRGVGGAVGALMTTDDGLTEVSVAVFVPPPVPLVAANEYAWVPAGSATVTEKVTPAAKSDPDVDMARVPTPPIFTTTDVGLQAAESAYVTVNLTAVPGVPDPGEAPPPLSVITWDAPLQEAA